MGCGCNIICNNIDKLDIEDAKNKLKKWGKTKYYLSHAEMQYKYITPKIVCERYDNNKGTLPEDYKFYCFNGVAKYVMICIDREKGYPRFYFLTGNGILRE